MQGCKIIRAHMHEDTLETHNGQSRLNGHHEARMHEVGQQSEVREGAVVWRRDPGQDLPRGHGEAEQVVFLHGEDGRQ